MALLIASFSDTCRLRLPGDMSIDLERSTVSGWLLVPLSAFNVAADLELTLIDLDERSFLLRRAVL